MIDIKAPLFQWDTNQKIKVDDGIVYVDYSGTEVIRVAVTDNEAVVPDEWLQTAGAKTIWTCKSDNTRDAHIVKIVERQMPSVPRQVKVEQ